MEPSSTTAVDGRAHRWARLLELLDAHPEATVGACDAMGQVQPLPGSVPLGPAHTPTAYALVTSVRPEDQPAVARAFQTMLATGYGEVSVRPADRPDEWQRAMFLDVREPIGVIVRLVVPTAEPSTIEIARRDQERVRARYGTMRQDVLSIILEVDDDLLAASPWQREDMVGRSGLDFVHPDDHLIVVDAWMRMLESGEAQRGRWRALGPNGESGWREVTLHNHLDDPADPHVLLGVLDIDQEVEIEEQLRRQELRQFRIAAGAPIGIFATGADGGVDYANDRLHRILGTTDDTTVHGLLATLVPEDRAVVAAAIEETLAGTLDEIELEAELVLPTGEPRRARFSMGSVTDADGRPMGAFAFVTDVTESARELVRLQTDLVRHAFHDSLTGLPNRALLLQRVGEAVGRAREAGDLVAVLLADLDGFKEINDSLGHTVGDELLRAVGDRMTSVLRTGGTVARLGGDEFVIMVDGFLDPERPRYLADQVLAALAQPFEVDGRTLRIGASIGIATTANARTTEELLRDADLAMYRAKEAGRGGVETFAPEMHEAVLARLELEDSLRAGIERGELQLHYQAIHDLGTGDITTVEALVRWHHPSRGLVSPAEFIPLAEDTGLIVPLGRWVLGTACHEAAQWTGGGQLPAVSVNLSGRQLAEDSVVDDVAAALAAAGLAPDRLVLEVTESMFVDESEPVVAKLEALRALGVRIAMDDFGTGYSSLSYLQRLPVDVLKVDKSFVDRVVEGGRYAAIVDGILRLSRSLSLHTVAEGIETVEQFEALRDLGCAGGQGYLFTRPLPRDDFRRYLDATEVGAPAAP